MWVIGCLALWIVVFPVYLVQRGKVPPKRAPRPSVPAGGRRLPRRRPHTGRRYRRRAIASSIRRVRSPAVLRGARHSWLVLVIVSVVQLGAAGCGDDEAAGGSSPEAAVERFLAPLLSVAPDRPRARTSRPRAEPSDRSRPHRYRFPYHGAPVRPGTDAVFPAPRHLKVPRPFRHRYGRAGTRRPRR